MEKEVWKNVVGYEGLYEVSNTAKVRNVLTKAIRKLYISKRGYYAIGLRKNGKTKSFPIHRIMALAFLERVNGKNYVDHIDGNRLNNFICINEDGTVNYAKTNLRWCSPSENNNNIVTHERHKIAMNRETVKSKIFNGLKTTNGETCPKEVFVYDLSNNFLNKFESISKASKHLKIDSGTISYAMRSKNHYAKGYKWYSKMIEPTQ